MTVHDGVSWVFVGEEFFFSGDLVVALHRARHRGPVRREIPYLRRAVALDSFEHDRFGAEPVPGAILIYRAQKRPTDHRTYCVLVLAAN